MFKKIANDGRILLVLYTLTVAIGVAGLMGFEHYKFIDALYGASTTITTAGFGDIVPKTDSGKLFIVAYQQFGIVIVLALTISWVLGKVNPDLFTDTEQKAIDAKLARIERKLDAKESNKR